MSRPETDGVLALDVGGTKVAAAFVDHDGQIRARQLFATGEAHDADELFDAVVEAMRTVGRSGSFGAVGVGCGGPMVWPQGLVSPLNIAAWRGFALRERLAVELGVPVRLHNDAVAMTVGEHWSGAGRGHDNLLGMVVSTGIGGGLVLDGRLIDGHTGNAGHVGHVVVEPDGPTCACGGVGCLEAVASGRSTVRLARLAGWAAPPGAGGRELADDARAGDVIAGAAFARTGRALGRGIASAVSLLDLSVVVVGGGLAQAADLIGPSLATEYAHRAGLEFARQPRVRWAQLGPDAGLVGAAALWQAGERYWGGD